MNKLRVFSYGSNMLERRIKGRISTVQYLGQAVLEGYKLVFNKKSKDDSAKANLVPLEGGRVYGVVYELSQADKTTLDRYEGLGFGYNDVKVNITYTEGAVADQVHCYIAQDENYMSKDSKPYHWYKNYVIKGAIEHNLPESYISEIVEVESIEDPDKVRRAKNALD